jgi:hypothetical protein
MMNNEAKERALMIWRRYQDKGEHFINAGQEFTHDELDRRRLKVIPEVLDILHSYLSGNTPLADFKSKIDSINKRNRHWGFKGINGQMYFNVLLKLSEIAGKVKELDHLLKESLPVPRKPNGASTAIRTLADFSKDLAVHVTDGRGAPKVGSICFFLSYFWQIQSPEVYPVYYTSMTSVLQEYNLWAPTDDVGANYESFFELNQELVKLFSAEAKRSLTLWDVEHAFWYMSQPAPMSGQSAPAALPDSGAGKTSVPQMHLPDGYIPPIVSILPGLAANDPELAETCRALGSSIEKTFEIRLDVLFKMLGYETESLGQGHGRVPDGVAICNDFHYAIVYDAKVRQQPYAMGTDERAIREYIARSAERLKKKGIRNIYFMLVSSTFDSDHNDTIRSLKLDTEAREILLVEAAALVALLEARLRDPSLTLGPDGIQRLYAESGVITEVDAREFQEI